MTDEINTNLSTKIEETDYSNDKNAEDNPYAYLERDFSSENFKIEVKNLPKYYGINEFRKLLNEKLKLASNKIKVIRKNSPFIFVCFRSNEDRENAIKAITNFKWKGKLLTAIKAKPAPDPLVKKRKDIENNGSNKKFKHDGRSLVERLKSSTVPLWNVPYEEQLKMKEEEIRKILTKFGNDLAHQNSELQEWLQTQKETYDGLPCELLTIRHSENINGYRNKCEFTVGLNEETKLPTVGFRIGSYVNGVTGIGPIDDLPHIPDSMKIAVTLYEKFVRSYKLEVYNPELQTGHFRQLTARSAKDQLMLVFGMHPQNLSTEAIAKFKEDVVEYFVGGEGKEANVTSMYYQELTKKLSGEDYVTEHLHGDTHIHEKILDLNFRISPAAFFQINTAAAEILYKSAIELACPSQSSTVVDICCGTGTIGLCFAKSCEQVLGLELITQAVDDAKENAKANGIENSEFFAGKAEDILSSICYRAKSDDVIGIIDPPRAGLHQKAVIHLRKVRKMKKL
ncbi:methyltransferase, partial [Oryctes borbonicus]